MRLFVWFSKPIYFFFVENIINYHSWMEFISLSFHEILNINSTFRKYFSCMIDFHRKWSHIDLIPRHSFQDGCFSTFDIQTTLINVRIVQSHQYRIEGKTLDQNLPFERFIRSVRVAQSGRFGLGVQKYARTPLRHIKLHHFHRFWSG